MTPGAIAAAAARIACAASRPAVRIFSITSAGWTSLPVYGVGVYRVTFDASVVGCGWSATLNDNDANSSPPGEISVGREPASSTNLLVRTFNSAGAQTESDEANGFTVVLSC